MKYTLGYVLNKKYYFCSRIERGRLTGFMSNNPPLFTNLTFIRNRFKLFRDSYDRSIRIMSERTINGR